MVDSVRDETGEYSTTANGQAIRSTEVPRFFTRAETFFGNLAAQTWDWRKSGKSFQIVW